MDLSGWEGRKHNWAILHAACKLSPLEHTTVAHPTSAPQELEELEPGDVLSGHSCSFTCALLPQLRPSSSFPDMADFIVPAFLPFLLTLQHRKLTALSAWVSCMGLPASQKQKNLIPV